MVTFEIMNIVQVQQIQARRQGGFEGFRSNPPLAPKDFIYTAIVHFKCRTSPLVSLLLRITAVQASLIVVSVATPHSAREGRGLVTSFTAVCCATLQCWTNHSALFSHMSVVITTSVGNYKV